MDSLRRRRWLCRSYMDRERFVSRTVFQRIDRWLLHARSDKIRRSQPGRSKIRIREPYAAPRRMQEILPQLAMPEAAWQRGKVATRWRTL